MSQTVLRPSLLASLDPNARPPRILIAEDDLALRGLLCEVLEDEGYDVVTAEDGWELLDRLGETWVGESYDLVLSDIRMPGCSGVEALEALRQRDWSTPVVLMTAFGAEETHAEVQRLGGTLFDKPFDLDELIEAIRERVPPDCYGRSGNW